VIVDSTQCSLTGSSAATALPKNVATAATGGRSAGFSGRTLKQSRAGQGGQGVLVVVPAAGTSRACTYAAYAFLHTLFWTGMRPSEAAGLRWGDIDPAARTARIDRSFSPARVGRDEDGTVQPDRRADVQRPLRSSGR